MADIRCIDHNCPGNPSHSRSQDNYGSRNYDDGKSIHLLGSIVSDLSDEYTAANPNLQREYLMGVRSILQLLLFLLPVLLH